MLLLPKNFGQLASVFANDPVDTALSDGITGGFAVVGYRGKTWSLRQGGQETILMRDDGDGARNAIDVVVIAASHVIAKTWYEQQYTEGSNMPPDCFSNNGVAPDPASTKKQNNLCATCRHNVIGSVITPAGKKAKACHDRKRMAVVPAGDLENEAWGGPMLLTAPPTSLGALMQFELGMRSQGFQYYTYVTRISFDLEEAYPRFVLAATRTLTDDEATIVARLRNDPRTERIIAETNSFDEAITDLPVEANATVVPLRPQQPAPANAPHSPPASAAAPSQPASQPTATQAAPPPKKRQGRPPKAAPAATAPAAAPQQTQQAQPAQRSTAGFGGAPAQKPVAEVIEEIIEALPEENETAVFEGSTGSEKLDAMLDSLLPQGNA